MTDPYGTRYTYDPTDLKYMQLAIVQAQNSIPAPKAYCVGAVLVLNDTILSVGYSREIPGNTHAEECALAKLTTDIDLQHATMYTTMEPCSVRLSGNVPCVTRILDSKIKRVVVGVREPPNLVSCEGIKLLEREGVEVLIVPNVQEDCLRPNQHILKQQ
ncbi:cytidine deaminase-like protein [Thamnidium elegans]|uniref:CMP/dCMP-type deaminase domain-containing protein n=1 Tax=Thamnidium elegans TaxID=101142 RepID=A0A8H7W057_9FUNG|nr:hypothetical protein INT48_002133 [Thamnidium elegans]KAI8094233.1 cytidine deaminase-like protein [Thamnidium elegans]